MSLNVGLVDLLVLAGYLLAATAFGAWLGRGPRSLEQYLVGRRDLPWWALLGSIVATETSTVTFLSVPGLAFSRQGDLRFLQLALGFCVGRVLIVWLLLPRYFQGRLYTAYQVLGSRFGPRAEAYASWLFLAARNVADGLRLFLTAYVLHEACGLSMTASIVALGVLTAGYTFVGGMRSVVWNDCLQLVVYVLGGLTAGVAALWLTPGGWEAVADYAVQEDKLRVFDFSWRFSDAYTFWAGLIGGAVLTMGTHGVDQLSVQRYLAARSQRDAARALVCSGLVVLVQFALFLLIGVVLAAHFHHVPPATPADSAAPSAAETDQEPDDGLPPSLLDPPPPTLKNDQALAHFVVHRLPQNVGLIGLILAGVFSAAMSTLSSSLNASAAVLANSLTRADTTESRRLALSRQATLLFAAVQVLVAIGAAYVSQSVIGEALAIAGLVTGCLLGVFALGVLTRNVNESSAMFGLTGGLVVLACVHLLTPIAWPWYALIGAVATFAYGWLDSWWEGGSPIRAAGDEQP